MWKFQYKSKKVMPIKVIPKQTCLLFNCTQNYLLTFPLGKLQRIDFQYIKKLLNQFLCDTVYSCWKELVHSPIPKLSNSCTYFLIFPIPCRIKKCSERYLDSPWSWLQCVPIPSSKGFNTKVPKHVCLYIIGFANKIAQW